MKMRVLLALTLSFMLVFSLAGAALANTATTWELNPDTNAEVSINEDTDTITLGVAGDLEGDSQPVAIHGASIELPPAEQIYVEFNYNLSTWDSYNAVVDENHTGYWDSFSISVSQDKYWNLTLTDPVDTDVDLDVGFLWGGTSFDDTVREDASSSGSATMAASTSSTNYLNVVLDTLTDPHHNGYYPSWGTFQITKIEITGVPSVTKELVDAVEDANVPPGTVGILDLNERWEFTMDITVTNDTSENITSVMVKDNFGGDLELVSTDIADDAELPDTTWTPGTSKKKKENYLSDNTGNVTVSWSGKTQKVHLSWDVGDLEPGDSATLTVVVATDMNTGKNDKFPEGHQEYTSGDEHCLNSGATATGFVTLNSGVWEVSDTSDEICVVVGEDPM